MLIVLCAIAGLCFSGAAAILWIAASDRRFARREERERQKRIDRVLRGTER